MKSFLEIIEYLFVEVLFIPYDFLRLSTSWGISNVISWLFILIGLIAAIYWILQLKKFDDNNEEDKSITSHSYL